jgi:hypothetical protein
MDNRDGGHGRAQSSSTSAQPSTVLARVLMVTDAGPSEPPDGLGAVAVSASAPGSGTSFAALTSGWLATCAWLGLLVTLALTAMIDWKSQHHTMDHFIVPFWLAGLAAVVLAALAGLVVLLGAPRDQRRLPFWMNALPLALAVAVYVWAMLQ